MVVHELEARSVDVKGDEVNRASFLLERREGLWPMDILHGDRQAVSFPKCRDELFKDRQFLM
jgi:hypothetical protein